MQPEQLASIVAAAIQSVTAPLVARIAALEKSAAVMGRDGRDGMIGLRGEKGDSGSSMSSGVGSPAFEGVTGDAYLDANTGDVYQWR